ncbi:ATP-grasp domain-containing protein [Chitinimonas viridis]|uniref:ATP-grasp domain-containing protein n=1 Tax=Chitinimonas viridis TaxID=664880 RepID=A0ABT8B4L0_9NEIS|nr:ATP-grasp domain-containing protein [Chitinimonas viridis]MDN3576665.1 ATP-grasp domain-containing protein [Chitinimonas viridis]
MAKRIAYIHPSFYVPYIFESAERNDVEFVVILPPGEVVQNEYPCVTAYETLPLYTDPEAAHHGIAELHARWQFDGIMTIKESCMVWTAEAAGRLGLPGIDPEAAKAARDKGTMRQRFKQAGLVTPKFAVISGMAEIELCREMAFPFIVKPASGYNSDGVQLVANQDELEKAIQVVERLNADIYHKVSWHDGQNFSNVVVEEFIEGGEYVVELFALDGNVVALNCGYKGHPAGPYFEETVYLSPPALPQEKIREIQSAAIGGMRALGLQNGPGHCELRLNHLGQPVILEIGARIGGSGCAHFNVEGSTDIDFSNLWFSYLTGAPKSSYWPPIASNTGKAASSWILPLGGNGLLHSIDGLDQVRQHPDCERVLMFAQIGKHYRPYPNFDGFLAIVFGQHASTQAGEEFFDFLERTLKVNWDPAPAVQPTELAEA